MSKATTKKKAVKKAEKKQTDKKPVTPAKKKNDLQYDESAYNDKQAWERDESIELAPDESDYNNE